MLVRTLEVDLEIEGDAWPVRIELYRDKEDETHYRARVWLLETFRVQPTFPQSDEGLPQDDPGDEDVLVEWSYNLGEDFSSYAAENEEEALEVVMAALEDFAAHAAGNGHADA